jgi:hypothetical protein
MTPHNHEVGIAIQNAFGKLNEAFVDLVFLMARNLKTDEMAPSLMGMDANTLTEYSKLSRSQLMAASRIGAPLVVARFNDPSTLKQVFSTGFSSERAIAALTRTMPLVTVTSGHTCKRSGSDHAPV